MEPLALTADDADDLMSFLETATLASQLPSPHDRQHYQHQHHRLLAKGPTILTIPDLPATTIKYCRQKTPKSPRLSIDAMKTFTGTPLLDALPKNLRQSQRSLKRHLHEQLRLNMIRRGKTPPNCTLAEVLRSGKWRGEDGIVPVVDVQSLRITI